MSSTDSVPVRRLTGDTLFNLALLGILFVVLMLPGGRLRVMLDEWWAGVAQTRAVESSWGTLRATTSVINRGMESGIEIIEFGDYECPFCRRAHPELEKFLEKHPEVGIAYRHYPLVDLHPRAEDAARVAICAEEQNRFREMHDRLLSEEDLASVGDWSELAGDVGVADLRAFSACLSSPRTEQRLAQDVALAKNLRIQGTPAFVFRGGIHRGYLTAEQLEELILD